MKLRAGRRFFADSRGRVKLGTASCAMAAKQCRTVRTRLERPRRPKAAAYGSGKLKVAPGQVKTLRVTLSPAARRTLRRKRSLRTRIVIRNGTAKPIVRTVTLRRR